MNIRQQANALYGAYSWSDFADLSEAEQFVQSFAIKNWNVSIDGPFESDYGRYQAIVSELAEENCTLGFALSDLLKISSGELLDLASLARSFLDELLRELAVSVGYKQSPEGQLNAYLYSLEECASIASIANDLIENAIENGDQSNSSQIIRQIFDKFKSHEAVEAGLALASVALTMRLVKANQFNYCLVAAFSTVKLIGSLSGWKLGFDRSASASGENAVANRQDQILKKNWQEHCRGVFDSGLKIEYLDDLLNVQGYDHRLMNQKPKTLRDWAKECIAGLKFKIGRPPKKK